MENDCFISDIEVGPSSELLSCNQYATNADYILENDHVAISGGALSATLSVSVVDDDLFEEEECFVAFIQSASWDEGRPEQVYFDNSPVVVYITDPDGKYLSKMYRSLQPLGSSNLK